jgi:hypothetical protein
MQLWILIRNIHNDNHFVQRSRNAHREILPGVFIHRASVLLVKNQLRR